MRSSCVAENSSAGAFFVWICKMAEVCHPFSGGLADFPYIFLQELAS